MEYFATGFGLKKDNLLPQYIGYYSRFVIFRERFDSTRKLYMKDKYDDVSVIILAEAALVYPKEQRVSLVRDQLILVFH